MELASKVLGRVVVIALCAAGVACRDNGTRSVNDNSYGGGAPAPRVTPDNSHALNANNTAMPSAVPNNNTGPWNSGGATGGVIGRTNDAAPSARGGGPVHMNDGDIAEITTVVNQGEIQQAQLARARAHDPGVRRFAEHMIQAHQQMLQSQSQLLGRIGITPASNDASRRIDLDGQATMQTLHSVTGDDFDRQYVDAQVRQHQQVLQTLDSQLIPNAQNAQFRQALNEARAMVQQHLDEGRRIQQALRTSPL